MINSVCCSGSYFLGKCCCRATLGPQEQNKSLDQRPHIPAAVFLYTRPQSCPCTVAFHETTRWPTATAVVVPPRARDGMAACRFPPPKAFSDQRHHPSIRRPCHPLQTPFFCSDADMESNRTGAQLYLLQRMPPPWAGICTVSAPPN